MNILNEILKILKFNKEEFDGLMQAQNIDRLLLRKGIKDHFEVGLSEILNKMIKENLINSNDNNQYYITEKGMSYIDKISKE